MAYDRLEPIGGKRLDYNTAFVVQTLWNIFRSKESPEPPSIGEIALRFGPDGEDAPALNLEGKLDFMMESLMVQAVAPTRRVTQKPRGG